MGQTSALPTELQNAIRTAIQNEIQNNVELQNAGLARVTIQSTVFDTTEILLEVTA